jgi:hypothetical protein
MKQPWLIQRARINKPYNIFKGLKMSDAVHFDYMGSSEFEWGALPKAFRYLKQHYHKIHIERIEILTKDGLQPLRVLSVFEQDDFLEYCKILQQLYDNKLQLQEPARFVFPNGSEGVRHNPDLWWDLENGVIWSFDKKFMTRIMDHLNESLKLVKDKEEDIL